MVSSWSPRRAVACTTEILVDAVELTASLSLEVLNSKRTSTAMHAFVCTCFLPSGRFFSLVTTGQVSGKWANVRTSSSPSHWSNTDVPGCFIGQYTQYIARTHICNLLPLGTLIPSRLIPRAGPRKYRKFHLRAIKNGNALKISTLKISTWPQEQGEHIGEEFFGVRVVVRKIWVLFVLRGGALFHTCTLLGPLSL